MTTRDIVSEHGHVPVRALSGSTPPSRSQADLRAPLLVTLVTLFTLAIGEMLVGLADPLYGAVWYCLIYVILVHLVIVRRPAAGQLPVESRWFEWRAAVLLSVVVGVRLLVLGMPPFQTRDIDIPGTWALPLLVGGILLARSSLLEGAWPPARPLTHRPRHASPRWVAWPKAPLIAMLAIASMAVGIGEGLLQGGSRAVAQHPGFVATVVVAITVQEWLYRRVVQPLAMRLWGVIAGGLVGSGLAGVAWATALATTVGPLNPGILVAIVVASALFGYVVTTIPKIGIWLVLLGSAAVTTAFVLPPP